MLKIRNLNVHYGGIHALRGVDIDVEEGQIVSIIGVLSSCEELNRDEKLILLMDCVYPITE
jgi:ABC-type polar amino acid transport system ATPase subunit